MLSTLARLYEVSGDDRWLKPATEVFGSLSAFRGFFSGSKPAPSNWLTTVNADGFLWFDRYSTGLETTASLTEQIWTALGIFDYSRVLATTSHDRQTARQLLAGAIATIEHYLPSFRSPGKISISNLATGGRDTHTHFVVKEQLKLLARITGSKTIGRYEGLLAQDDDLPYFVTQPVTIAPAVDTYDSVPGGIAASPAAARPLRATPAGKPSRSGGVVDPTENAGFAIACMVRYQRTGDRAWFSRARRAVDEAMATAENGALPHEYGGRDVWGNRLEVPWYSARTQGLMLSALSLLYEAGDGNARLVQARHVFSALTQVRDYGYPPPRPWISVLDASGFLWFEQLADGDETSLLVQGHLTALLGIYDYWRITRSPEAREYFAGGIATIRHVLPELRAPNSIMLASPRVHTRDPRAHPVITRQIDTLARITGNDLLTRYARLLAKDLAAVRARTACPAEENCNE